MSQGVEWIFSIVDRATGPVAALNKSIEALTAATSKSDEALRKISESIEGLGNHSEHAKEKSESLFRELLKFEAVKATFEFVAEGVKSIAESMIEADGSTRTFERGLKRFGDEANEVREDVEIFKKQTHLGEDALKSFAVQLGQAGFKGKEIRPIFASIADASADSADKVAAANSALKVWTTLGSKEGLSKKTFQDLNIPIAEMTKTLGVTEEVLLRMGKNGKADVERLGVAILETQRRINGGIGVRAGEARNDLDVLVTKFKELPTEVFDELSHSPALEAFREKLGLLYDKLSNPENIEKFAKAFEPLIDNLSKIDINQVVKSIEDGMPKAVAAVDIAVEAFKLLIPIMGGIVTSMQTAAGIYYSISGEKPENTETDIKYGPTYWQKNINNQETYDLAVKYGESITRGVQDGVLKGDTDVLGAISKLTQLGRLPSEGNQSVAPVSEGVIPSAHDFMWRGGQKINFDPDDTVLGVKGDRADAVTSGSFGSGEGGKSSVSIGDITVTVAVQGGSGASAEEIGAQVAKMLPGAIVAATERLAQQQGGY